MSNETSIAEWAITGLEAGLDFGAGCLGFILMVVLFFTGMILIAVAVAWAPIILLFRFAESLFKKMIPAEETEHPF